MESNLLTALWKSNSRKVAFGVILYITATILLLRKLIPADDWMFCVGAATALIGGGTLADKWLGKKITLYASTTEVGGETVECIRVRNKVPA